LVDGATQNHLLILPKAEVLAVQVENRVSCRYRNIVHADIRMALNNGSPVQLDHGDTLTHVRRFLTHPLATHLDGRLVAACELLETRCGFPTRLKLNLVILHEYRNSLSNVITNDSVVDEKMRLVNHRVEAWQVFWSDYYGQ